MFCGIDWSERHHDVAVVDQDGNLIAKRRISDDATGFAELLTMLAEIGDHDQDPVPVAIETPRGLLVAALRSTERLVYAINPMAMARYRERWTPARSKSDHADAMVLANILRTLMPGDGRTDNNGYTGLDGARLVPSRVPTQGESRRHQSRDDRDLSCTVCMYPADSSVTCQRAIVDAWSLRRGRCGWKVRVRAS